MNKTIIGAILGFAVSRPFDRGEALVITDADKVDVLFSFRSSFGQLNEGFILSRPWHFIRQINLQVQRV